MGHKKGGMILKYYKRLKRETRTREGVLKILKDKIGIKRYYCIGCKKYLIANKMKREILRIDSVGSYCIECENAREKKRIKKKTITEIGRHKVKEGKLVGRSSTSNAMRHPPRDAIPRSWCEEGYERHAHG